MKKIYDYEQFFYIKGQTRNFECTSIWRHLRALDEEQVMAYERRYGYQSFQELWELVESGAVLNAEAQKTLLEELPAEDLVEYLKERGLGLEIGK